MVRRSLSTPPDDPVYTDVAGEEQVKEQILDPDPDRHGPAGRTCPTCNGKGTVVKNGPSEWEYDNQWPCPTCTADRTSLKGTGTVAERPTTHCSMCGKPLEATLLCPYCGDEEQAA